MGMNTAAVQRLYVAYFNRPADPVSLAVYRRCCRLIEATQAELQVIAETYFSPSAEYTTNFEGLSNTQIVDKLYQNIFGRTAEADGLVSWAAKLADGSITVAELALQLSYSAQGTDAAVVNARIAAATTFTESLDTTAEINGYNGNDAAAGGKTYLAQISGELPTTEADITAQKDAAIAGVDASVQSAITPTGEAVAGQTFTLSTGLDTSTGGAGNDTVNALPTTLTVGDTFDGGAGSDTVSLTSSLSANTSIGGFTLNNVENLAVNITDADAAGAETLTLNLAGTDSDKVTLSGLGTSTANDTLALTNVAGGTTIAMNSATDLNVTATFTAAATAGTTALGTPDSVNVEVAGVSRSAAGDNTLTVGAGFETMNLASNTSASRLDQITFGGTTLNISGDANLTIDTDLDASLTTIDASAFTGKLSIDTSTNAAPDVTVGGVDVTDLTLTGGSGNDTLDVSQNGADNEISVSAGAGDDTVTIGAALAAATTSNAGDQIDGGAGTDTLAGTSAVINGLTQAGTTGVSGFETLAITDALAHTITAANAQASGISTVSVAGGTGGLVMAAGDVNVALGASLTGALSLTDTGVATTDSVTISNSALTADDMGDGNNLTVTGYETVNIVTSAVSDTSQDFGTITLTGDLDADAVASDTTLNISGSDRASVGAVTATTIDASGMTAAGTGTTFNMTTAATSVTTITGSPGADTLRGDAKSTINGGAGNDTIVGGTGNDTLNGGDGRDNITAGTGSDTISGGAGNDTIVMAGNISAADTIDGGDGVDTLSVTNASLTALQALTISEANAFNTGFNNVETLLISDAMDTTNDSFDLGYLDSVTTVAVTTLANDAETIAGFSSGSTLSLSTTLGQALTATVAGATTGASDVLNVSLTANSDDDYGAVTIANVETLNVDVTQSTASAASITNTIGFALSQTSVAGGGSGAAQTVNFSGTEDINVDTAIAVATIDASGMSARLATTPGLVMDTLATATTAMPGQTITGSSGADTLKGSSGADSITGGAGNDTLVGGAGADTINGTSGSNTFSTEGMVAANIDGTGTGTSTGVVVNLGSTALTNVAVANAISKNLSSAITSVPAGSASYVFDAAANTNSASLDTLSNIENVTLAGNGVNYVVGSDNANTVTLGTGNDNVSTGKGSDTVATMAGNNTIDMGAGDDTITIATGANLDTNDTIAGGTGTDVIQLTNVAGQTGTLDDQTGIETVTIVDGADGADSGLTITYTNADTSSITVDASALDAGENFTLNTSDAQVTGATTFRWVAVLTS